MEYVNKDSRVKVIDKENRGYGHSMNCGFDMAEGEYISIVESDDYAELDMLEKLYSTAKKNELDVCKGSFFWYFSYPEEKNLPFLGFSEMRKDVFCPTTDFKSLKEQAFFFSIKPTIWSAIYRKGFIRENGIRFNETPGASFQDTSFNFKVWALAKRVQLLKDAVIHYRQDNEGSSVNSKGKTFCVCDEFAEMERFINDNSSLAPLLPILTYRKLETYIWNYERLNEEEGLKFLLVASKELSKDVEDLRVIKDLYPAKKLKALNYIIKKPIKYHKNFRQPNGFLKRIAKKLLYSLCRKDKYEAYDK